MAALWATGELWLAVPETMRITLNGTLQAGVMAKDLMLYILQQLTVTGGQYRAVELAGTALSGLSLDERPVIPNMMSEFGALSAYLPPDDAVYAYLEAKRTRDYTPLFPDENAVYAEDHTYEVSHLEPLVALPHQPDQVVPLSQAIGQPIQQAFIGTCTGGRYEDLAAAAKVVQGKQAKIRFVIIPASVEVLKQATQSGVLLTLLEAGATITTPGCGPCMGNHMGVPAPNEATISTGSRNFKGRMGTKDATIYLSNAAVVAAAALAGEIVPVGEFVE
jgi:homoaconitase/3-isopropylmalate dehydratase large subunit